MSGTWRLEGSILRPWDWSSLWDAVVVVVESPPHCSYQDALACRDVEGRTQRPPNNRGQPEDVHDVDSHHDCLVPVPNLFLEARHHPQQE